MIRYCRQDSRDEIFSVSAVLLQEHSAEYRAFRKHFVDLFECIQNPPTLSACLFSMGLLSSAARKKICSFQLQEQQLDCLLGNMEGQVKGSPQNFHKFVEALEKDQSMQHLCDKLRDTCGEYKYVCLIPVRVKLTGNTCLCCYCSTTQIRDTSSSVTITTCKTNKNR